MLFLTYGKISFCQDYTVNEFIEGIIEQQTLDETSTYNLEEVQEQLEYYYKNPLDINTASRQELADLLLLNGFQITSIIDYRKNYGNFVSIYELQYVFGFDKELIKQLSSFITISGRKQKSTKALAQSIHYIKNDLMIRASRVIQRQKGYEPGLKKKGDNHYIGSPEKIYTRYRMKAGKKIMAGLTMDKDPGEPFFSGNNKWGYDHYSGYFQLTNIGKFKTINIGDYKMSFGQGLAIYSGFGFGKSSYVTQIKKTGNGLQKYASANENNYFRGLSTTLMHKNIRFTPFYSTKHIDANIAAFDSINNDVISVSSLQNSGLHNTASLMQDKDAINETTFGANISFNHSAFKIGGNFIRYNNNAVLLPQKTPKDKYDFYGSGGMNSSIYYQYGLTRDIILFGEAGIDKNISLANIHGVLMKWQPGINFSALYRYYPRSYYARYGNSFAESTSNSNEEGFYIGMEIDLIKSCKLSLYADNYKFPWLKYRITDISNGVEYFSQADLNLSSNVSVYARYKYENKPQDLHRPFAKIKIPENYKKQTARLHIKNEINKNLRLQNRIELSKTAHLDAVENGFMLYQDIKYSLSHLPLTCYFRYTFFDTDGYNSRIYTYENDVLYSFSIPAFFDEGSRSYLMIKLELNKSITIWCRYACTYYTDKTIIGSGLNEINGDTKSDLTMQMRFSF
jgi:hypothetical protein